jgi:hypothetical protein
MAKTYRAGSGGPGQDLPPGVATTVKSGPIPGTYPQIWTGYPAAEAAQTAFQEQGRKTVPKTYWKARVAWDKANDDALITQTLAKDQTPYLVTRQQKTIEFPAPRQNWQKVTGPRGQFYWTTANTYEGSSNTGSNFA